MKALQLSLLSHSANLQLLSVFLQHALIMVFPKLFRGVFSCYALENFGASGVFFEEIWGLD